jgi:hypothetical protein
MPTTRAVSAANRMVWDVLGCKPIDSIGPQFCPAGRLRRGSSGEDRAGDGGNARAAGHGAAVVGWHGEADVSNHKFTAAHCGQATAAPSAQGRRRGEVAPEQERRHCGGVESPGWDPTGDPPQWVPESRWGSAGWWSAEPRRPASHSG